MTELTRRILFALVGAPLTIALIYAGGWVLAARSARSRLGAWEFFRIARAGGPEPLDHAGIVLAAVVPLVVHAQLPRRVFTCATAAVLIFLVLLASVIWARGVAAQAARSSRRRHCAASCTRRL